MNTANNNKTENGDQERRVLSSVASDDQTLARHELSSSVIEILESEAKTEIQLRKKERIDPRNLSNSSRHLLENEETFFVHQSSEEIVNPAKPKSLSIEQSRRGNFAFGLVSALLFFLFLAFIYSYRHYITNAIPILEPILHYYGRLVEDSQLWLSVQLGFDGS